MGFIDSIKEALGGDRGNDADATASSTRTGPRQVDPTPRTSVRTASRPRRQARRPRLTPR